LTHVALVETAASGSSFGRRFENACGYARAANTTGSTAGYLTNNQNKLTAPCSGAGGATQVTVRGAVVVNSGDETVSAYLVSTYDFDRKHIAISVDVVDRKISNQQAIGLALRSP
jgi:hypothetical protein